MVMNLRQNMLRIYLSSRVWMAGWNLLRKHHDQHLRATEVRFVIYLDPRGTREHRSTTLSGFVWVLYVHRMLKLRHGGGEIIMIGQWIARCGNYIHGRRIKWWSGLQKESQNKHP